MFQSEKKNTHMIAACPPPASTIYHSENKRQVLRKVRDKTIYLSIKLRRGAKSAPFTLMP